MCINTRGSARFQYFPHGAALLFYFGCLDPPVGGESWAAEAVLHKLNAIISRAREISCEGVRDCGRIEGVSRDLPLPEEEDEEEEEANAGTINL